MKYTIYKGARIVGYMHSTGSRANVQKRALVHFGNGVIAK